MEKNYKNNHKTSNKMTIRIHLSITTLNVNELNTPVKRHRVTEWIKKQDPSICYLQETHFRPKDTCRSKVKGQKNIYHANGIRKKVGVAVLISDKINLKTKTIIKNKGEHYIMIQGKSSKRIYKLCVQHVTPKYIKQLLTDTKEEIDKNNNSRGL